jgi:hypothetical protein
MGQVVLFTVFCVVCDTVHTVKSQRTLHLTNENKPNYSTETLLSFGSSDNFVLENGLRCKQFNELYKKANKGNYQYCRHHQLKYI